MPRNLFAPTGQACEALVPRYYELATFAQSQSHSPIPNSVGDFTIGFVTFLEIVRQQSCSYPMYVSPQDDSHAYISTDRAKPDVFVVLILSEPGLVPQKTPPQVTFVNLADTCSS